MRNTGAAFALTLARQVTDAGGGEVRYYAALGFESTDVEKGPDGTPTAFRMWRAGLNRTDHGDHNLTSESIAKLLGSQATRGNRFSIDVDHMSLNNQAPPENHKAVGWFDIEARDGDLWAVNVQWTDAVRDGLAKEPPEWRYFSPAYDTKKDSGEIVRLLNLALTNNPATHHVTALANMATAKETAMADDEKEQKDEETLGAMLAAFENEKDEEKRSKMKSAIRAKFKAAFPDEGEKTEKDEESEEEPEKKETKKADAADGDPDNDGDKDKKNEEKIAASIADKALINFEAARRARDEKLEIDRILASLPPGDRETYKDFSLTQLERVVKRHHADVLTRHAAAATAMPVRGSDQSSRGTSMLPASEREKLDAAMGLINHEACLVKEEGTTLTFNPYATKEDANRVLASIRGERTKGAKNDAEALNRVLANQKGVA